MDASKCKWYCREDEEFGNALFARCAKKNGEVCNPYCNGLMKDDKTPCLFMRRKANSTQRRTKQNAEYGLFADKATGPDKGVKVTCKKENEKITILKIELC